MRALFKQNLDQIMSQWCRFPLFGPVFKFWAPRRNWEVRNERGAKLRVLIVNLYPSLGDAIWVMPTIEVLKEAIPGVDVTWLADSRVAALARAHPDVDRVLSVHTPRHFLQRLPIVRNYYRLYTILHEVKELSLRDRFDIAIVPHGRVDTDFSAHAAWMMNVPRTIGYSYQLERNYLHHYGDVLLTEVVREAPTMHEAERSLHLLQASGLVLDSSDRWNKDKPIHGLRVIAEAVDYELLMKKVQMGGSIPFLVVSPGAGEPRRMWPAEKFRALCARILEQSTVYVVLTGTQREEPLAALVKEGLGERVINCAGKLNLFELTALISHAIGFVGNDSGTGHLAGLLAIPTVSLHVQPKNCDTKYLHLAEKCRPVGPNVTLLQPDTCLPPCEGYCDSQTLHCLDQIIVDQVWAVVKRILSDANLLRSASDRR
jgi:ADP-heptose:LPS heptosyltransferase